MFRTLLVPLDRSTLAEQAVATAAAVARASKGEMSLVLAHRSPLYDSPADLPLGVATSEEKLYIRALALEVTRGTGVTASGIVEAGEASEVICRRAQSIGADLIVMTSHGRTGISRAWL